MAYVNCDTENVMCKISHVIKLYNNCIKKKKKKCSINLYR